MKDILTFNTFITQDILVFFYYVGAVLMPVVLYFFKDYLIENISFVKTIYDKLYMFYSSFSSKRKIVFWMMFITIFLCMELCWRMMFEAMIGYFDMHDYLYKIANKIGGEK
ncbi:hypothetical protein YH65_06345 [Sulfurovum lithotrophicum]|uniref:DUF4282 domain-containing protein n=1 Tax=Sulfurovum lithotrophicum TaxID=206403 RepID=A0A7U4M1K6_9BACT|nr:MULTISPECIES: DUF4282 domain-containing protein [Sulfurovum]AKF25054.1 hypothetical protein YH65_06345 [Sulfurovum lithotrophicum]BAF72358.1 hypothetical protein SUN_1407 [Sulfurovum sp. NBC37-1]